MRKSVSKLSQKEIYSFVKNELNINKRFEEVRNCSFNDLHIPLYEVNSALNTFESKYGFNIKDEGISIQTNFNEFIRMILMQA